MGWLWVRMKIPSSAFEVFYHHFYCCIKFMNKSRVWWVGGQGYLLVFQVGERGKSQQINKIYKFTFSVEAFRERVLVDESEFLPFPGGHKSQTRFIFENTYGDAFDVRTLNLTKKWVIDYFLVIHRGVIGDCSFMLISRNFSSFKSYIDWFSLILDYIE